MLNGQRRLLVLDDDRTIGDTIASIAESIGIVSRAESMPSAFFDAVEKWDPTHIALDLVMPEMDGVQVIERLASRHCRANIILTSGVGGRVLEAAQRSAKEHGLSIIGALPKPFAVADFARLLTPLQVADAPSPRPIPIAAQSAERAFEVTCDNLRHAIEHRELLVVFQPKVVCTTGAPAGVEALVRWMHPDWGVIPPDMFIAFAEQNGLIGPLTDVVVNDTLTWLSRVSELHPGLTASVNVSAKSLGDVRLADRLLTRCDEHGIDPSRVILELTETSAMDDPLASLDLLTRLRMKGFHLSLDDFGTGYSSMLQLVRLPFSELKIDKSFVATATRSAESRAVVNSIVMLASSLGLTAVAEGVEELETLTYLTSIGCDLAQGYHCGRPMSAEAVNAWLAAHAVGGGFLS